MFDIGWSELLVIAVVAIIVVGPKELPRLMRTFGHYVGKLRRMAADFQRQFEEAVRDSEIDEVRKAMRDFHAQASDIHSSVDKPLMAPKAAPAPAPIEVTAPAVKPKAKPLAKKPKTNSANKKIANKKTAAETVDPSKPKTAPKPRKPRKPKEQTP
jgi:sec-independent protein translocase protein TatB